MNNKGVSFFWLTLYVPFVSPRGGTTTSTLTLQGV
jgi:hypothetical protein